MHWGRFSQMQKYMEEIIFDVMTCYHALLVIKHIRVAVALLYDL